MTMWFLTWGHTAKRKSALWLTCWLLLIFKNVSAARRDDLIVVTEKGRIQGTRHYLPHLGKAVNTFLGIPFAKPPVSHLRFRHPVPVDSWQGIYNATKAPNSCYQVPDLVFGDFVGSSMWNPTTNVSEDCLYINVWVPKNEKRLRKSAVLVWIYGGGFYSGTSTLNCYDGKVLAAENNIIVVSINYRVGVLGFLSLGHPHAPGNAGLFDQLMGLEWVQQNIRHFGGDPHNVTLFGESAGSASVSFHLLSPLSQPKFQRAIMQSGTANMPWATTTPEEGKRRSVELAVDYLGCRDSDMVAIIDCLKEFLPNQLVQKQWVSRGLMQFPFLPVIDGTFLTETPEMSLQRKSFKKCPVLMGSNRNEGSWFLIYDLKDKLASENRSMTQEQFNLSMETLFGFYPQFPQELNSFGLDAIKFQYSDFLNPENEDRNIASLESAVAECHFICHVNKFAEAYAAAGENVYMYYFTQRYSSNPWPKWMGVLHGDEILFTFGDPLKPGTSYTEDEKLLSRKMMRYWTNFAKTGDPNRVPGQQALGDWPLHTRTGQEYLELNTKFLNYEDKTEAVGRGPRINACAFWNQYLPQLVTATNNLTKKALDGRKCGRSEKERKPEVVEPEPLVPNITCASSKSAGFAVSAMDAMFLVFFVLLPPAAL